MPPFSCSPPSSSSERKRHRAPADTSSHFNDDSDWIRVAYLTLAPLLGTAAASTLFAIALLASGQSSTITGTLAGQVVMEGFMHWRIEPWRAPPHHAHARHLPAVVIIGLRGDSSVTDLLTLSQVVLALQLPVRHVSAPALHQFAPAHGELANGWFLLIAGWGSAILITAHGYLWPSRFHPDWLARHCRRINISMYDTILVTLDGTPTDRAIIEHVKDLARLAHSRLVLLHVADGWAARTYGPDAVSPEISEDTNTSKKFAPNSNQPEYPPPPNSPLANRPTKSSSGFRRKVATSSP